MIFTYHQEGSEQPTVWVINLGKFRVSAMEAIEKRTSMAYATEFRQALMLGNATARRALLWTKLRESHHTLRYEDVDFADDEVTLEMDSAEWAAMRAEVVAKKGIDEETLQRQLEIIDAAAANAPAPPGKAPAPLPTPEPPTD